MSRRGLAGGLATALALALGCDSGAGTLAPVRGTVSYRGAPLRSGSIAFVPDSTRGGNGPLARADIQANGGYVLHTGDQAGVAPGWHRVTIVAFDSAPAAPGEPFALPRLLLPARYRDADLSGLTCEVQAGKDNEINFNLAD